MPQPPSFAIAAAATDSSLPSLDSLQLQSPAVRVGLTLALGAPVFALLLRRLWRKRVGKRALNARFAPTASSSSARVAPAECGNNPFASHERAAGCLERWYADQPDQRYFVQAVRVRAEGANRVPSEEQLARAISAVMMRHPTLLVLPAPSGRTVTTQLNAESLVTEQEGGEPALRMPLAQARAAVLPTMRRIDDESVHAALQRLLNMRLPAQPNAEEYAARAKTATGWDGLRVQLVSSPDCDEFELVWRLAHTVGDGGSGFVFARHLLSELAGMMQTANLPSNPPAVAAEKSLPLHLVRPIASYPALDDLLDVRPTFGAMLQLLAGEIKSNVRKLLGMRAPDSMWDGPVQMPKETASELRFVRTLEWDAATLARFSSLARDRGCTLHSLLLYACGFASGLVAHDELSECESALLKLNTPISLRPLLATAPPVVDSKGRQLFDATPPSDLIGNFVTSHSSELRVSARESTPFWKYARSLRPAIAAGLDSNIHRLGMIPFIDVRQFVLQSTSDTRGKRNGSIEVSNLGLLDPQEKGAAGGMLPRSWQSRTGWTLRACWFVQPSDYTASVFSTSVVSTAAGGLRALTSFPPQLVSDEVAQRFAAACRLVVDCISQGGDPTFADLQQRWKQEQQQQQ